MDLKKTFSFAAAVIGSFIVLCTHSTTAKTTRPPTRSQAEENITKRFDTIFANYDKRFRPNINGDPVIVNVDLHVMSVININEEKMEMTIDFYLRQRWRDPRLAHGYGKSPISVSPSVLQNIWLPDIFFVNGMKINSEAPSTTNKMLRIAPDGEIIFSCRVILKANCFMDFTSFPFDTQNCSIDLQSYRNAKDEVRLQWMEGSTSAVTMKEGIILEHYDLLSVYNEARNDSFSTGSFVSLITIFTLKRKIGYYLTNTYLPAGFIIVISWISFWIPLKSAPARIALGITAFLAVTSLSVASQENLPRVEYIKAIDWFLFACFLSLGATLAEYALALHLRRKAKEKAFEDEQNLDSSKQISKDYNRLLRWKDRITSSAFGFSSLRKMSQSRVSPVTDSEISSASSCNIEMVDLESGERETDNSSAMQNKSEEAFAKVAAQLRCESGCSLQSRKEKTLEELSILDSYCRIIFPVTFGAFNLYYWLHFY